MDISAFLKQYLQLALCSRFIRNVQFLEIPQSLDEERVEYVYVCVCIFSLSGYVLVTGFWLLFCTFNSLFGVSKTIFPFENESMPYLSTFHHWHSTEAHSYWHTVQPLELDQEWYRTNSCFFWDQDTPGRVGGRLKIQHIYHMKSSKIANNKKSSNLSINNMK